MFEQPPPPLTFCLPEKAPGTNLPYPYDMSPYMAASGDTVAIASVAISPSGAGEMAALDLSVNANIVTMQLAGGVAGRFYGIQLTVTGLSGRVWQIFGQMLVGPLASWPPVDPPSWGFGTLITWTSGATVYGPAIAAVATGLVATGTGQSTALTLAAQTNVFASAPSGTSGILPAIVSGTIVVQDDDQTYNLPIYPPVGAQINALGVNAPFVVGAQGGRISFSTQSSATQWYAG